MNVSISKKLKHLLTLRNMNQADLARQSGVAKATISELINNKQRNASVELINKLAKALRVPPAYFLEENAVTPFEAVPHLPEEIQKFILDSENMNYIVLAHKLKNKALPVEAIEKIIEVYEALLTKEAK